MNGFMRADLARKIGSAPQKAYIERERPGLSRAALSGRLVELSGQGSLANLTLACGLVLEAQREGETTAWVAGKEATFYPPDAAVTGIDLAAIAVVRCPDRGAILRAADRLARSGAFGLLVLDLGANAQIPLVQQSRLAGLARRHDAAIVFLTEKADHEPSMGSLVSLRGRTRRRREADGRFVCSFEAVKDKRRGPGWEWKAVYHGAPGLC